MSDNPVAMIRKIQDSTGTYDAIMLWCPGCEYETEDGWVGGLNLLPVSGDGLIRPTWEWNGDLVNVTLSPSILTCVGTSKICHSYLTAGRWRFLDDCTHVLSGQAIEMTPLPDWVVRDA